MARSESDSAESKSRVGLGMWDQGTTERSRNVFSGRSLRKRAGVVHSP